MRNKKEIKSLIRRFVENRASEHEIELLQEYFKTPLGLKFLSEIIDEYALDFNNRVLIRLTGKLPNGSEIKDERGIRSITKSRPLIAALAASFIGVAVLIGLYVFHMTTVYETVAGEKKIIKLPDNTIVIMNGNSSISYQADWSDLELRSVDVSGEAYLKVTSNPEKPFVVNTSGISIRVLGTTFNIKSYDEDDRVETTLIEGKIVIERLPEGGTASERIEMSPDQKATYSKRSKEIKVDQADAESEAGWIRRSLLFENEPLSEIVKDLERLYGTKIYVQDTSSLRCRFTTRLQGESLEEILKLFSLSEDVKYRIRDNEAWIDGNLCDQNYD